MSAPEEPDVHTSPGPGQRRPSTLRRALAVREFRGIIFAQATSDLGDQIARVALALLVLERTGSSLGAAATFAITFVPAFFGAAFLGPLADRLSRRGLMLGADFGRFVVISILALVAVPGAPLPLLLVLLLVAEFMSPVFESARTASVPSILVVPALVSAGASLSRLVHMVSQIVGLVIGGLAVALINPRAALSLDALSFLASFVILAATLVARPAALPGPTTVRALGADLRDGMRLIRGDPTRRSLVLLAWAMVFTAVGPEALGLSYSLSVGTEEYWGGILMASIVGGAAVGAVLIARVPPLRQVELVLPLALACNLPLLLTGLEPPVILLSLLWFLAGMAQAFFITIIAFTGLLTVDENRGRVAAIGAAGFAMASVLGMLTAGGLADATSPAFAVTVVACIGLVFVAVASRLWPAARILEDVAALEGSVEGAA